MSEFPEIENGKISFKGRTAIVSGAGNGLGRAYAIMLAQRGCKVLVNDLGPSMTDKSRKAADVVVEEIKKAGGEAVANYDSNVEGHKLVKQAIDTWGRIDIVINNAGILRDKSFKSMTDAEFDAIVAVHITGSYAIAHAAWPYMRKQKYGRIINISSAAGIYGNFGQANYSAAKLAMNSFSKTLAIEGAKYNIIANTVAPIAASQMLATIMPPEVLEQLKPEFVSPLVAYLVSAANKDVTGQLVEAGAGFMAGLRRERSKGAVFRADDTFTPSAVRARIDEILNFENDPQYPEKLTDANHLEFLERAKGAKANDQGDVKVRYDGKTVLVTGAGAGLGKAYALMFAKLGANVVVNDFSEKAAAAVVEEIKKAGGKAAPAIGSVEDGAKIVKAATDAYGGLHVIINNAGILRDKSFASMNDDDWHAVVKVHLRGTYAVCKAAWPIFLQQKYGRIVNTTSAVGIYGNFGQANYSAAKGAILGLTQTLAIEGKKYNILANTIAPNAGTAMTATIWPQEMVDAFKPDFVAPVVGFLASEANTEVSKQLFEVSGGWVAAVRWQRSGGHAFSHAKIPQPEAVQRKIGRILDFDSERASWPQDNQEAMQQVMANIGQEGEGDDDGDDDGDHIDPEDPAIVKEAKKQKVESTEFAYSERDVILYNLGLGAKATDLNLTYEQADDFHALPTFGVIPQFAASSSIPLDWLPNFSPMMLLHGEQYLAIKKPIPTSATLVNKPRLLEVLDKGKAAAVTTVTHTVDKESGDVIFENQSTVFIRGAGGFGGKKNGKDRGDATALNKPPTRKPDAVIEEKTSEDQAALYRLSGDYNPLHIDPEFSKVGGFERPILHGLCFFGISGKHVFQKYGAFSSIKVRFASTVLPGQTLVTEMWKEGNKVIFQSKVKESGSIVLSNAACTFSS
ncbi:putative multifunctional beta-oxidation protein [Tilletiaria anomala UBC 951]|uniref:Putative multifunctional beta-oxidation protein n=1 Tax=Tilletiaria anomala (strain ATCC 24038 / CBS 436.72 / UBC 951) TaxID=1037660 RepID=A0A066WG62_TILAU|nr:putative multifunctional beta-oxidation protein [Tilletiaria anomala UBC 951]KDN52771.1 putative multifunctional beta-oxidation protein [Tilletiaria anomala UBC 951]